MVCQRPQTVLVFLLTEVCLGIIAVSHDFPFYNTSLPWESRVQDLVDRLTLHEVVEQMSHGGSGPKAGPTPAIPRLGIGPYQFDEECLHGVAEAGEATAFPQAIGLAAAFSQKLMFDVAAASSAEVRAKHNDFVKQGVYHDHTGLSCFSPVINIMRHPFWGRNQETYGEDPYLSGVYARQFVQGLQGSHPRYVMANAGCKHFDAYGGPENVPVSRFKFDAVVKERDLRLTFLPAFKACVDAGTYSIMCSYNSVNGVPACANHHLLTKILRYEWGFRGYVISDQGALEHVIDGHHFVNTTVEAAALCVEAGCNIELSGNNPAVYSVIEEAVTKGMLSERLVRERVKPLFYTRMRLGEFDPPEMNPYNAYNLSLVQSPEHRQLAIQAAMQTFVLLKNQGKLLPIKKHFNKIAIVGPMADSLSDLYGSYAAVVDPKYGQTPRQGLQKLADKVLYASGCDNTRCKNYSAEDIKSNITGAQLVVVCIGTGVRIETESNDRDSMDLPGHQDDLVQDALQAGEGSPVLLLVFSAGPVNISALDSDPRVTAIVQCFFPAQATGEALFNMVTMATRDASPAARLPYTWYHTADQIPSMTDYTMVGRTYRYFTDRPLYPFGYGLSYSKFEYLNVSVIPSILAGDDQYLEGYVQNIGSVDAYEVIQVYISWESATQPMPIVQLVGFDRVFIEKGTIYRFRSTITAQQMAVWTDEKGFIVQSGVIQVYLGGQQPHQVISVGSNVLETVFVIQGKDRPL